MGAFLIAAAAVIVFSAVLSGTRGRDGRPFAVASRPLPAGAILEPGDLTTANVRLPAGVAAQAFGDPARLLGRSLIVGVAQGSLVESSMVAPASGSPDLRPVTVTVDATSLPGLSPGEPVDVLQTSGNDTSTSVAVILRGAIVLSVSRGSTGLVSGGSSSTATLGVSTLQEVESIVAGSHSGTLTIVKAKPSDGVGAGPPSAGG